jgi:RNA polymerase sigma factor (sigma-70 family)
MGLEASQKYHGLASMTNWELFNGLRNPEILDSQFQNLFTLFYHRFKDRLYRRSFEIAKRNESLAKELFQETMIKASKSIKKLKLDPLLTDDGVGDKAVAWLGVILNREFVNYLRGKKKEIKICDLDSSFDDFESNYDTIYEDEERQNLSFLRIKFDNIFSKLDEKEQYILLMCAHYNCLFNNNHLPDEVVKDICEKYGITSNYLRLIKKRAIEKFDSN